MGTVLRKAAVPCPLPGSPHPLEGDGPLLKALSVCSPTAQPTLPSTHCVQCTCWGQVSSSSGIYSHPEPEVCAHCQMLSTTLLALSCVKTPRPAHLCSPLDQNWPKLPPPQVLHLDGPRGRSGS